tara:strand:+ start:695 stop:1282 length:588 start_codon:yes stop_codon:yes gene_type:complete
MAWAKNGTPVTLGSAAGVMTISDMTANVFNMIMYHTILASGNASDGLTFDNNTNTDYSRRMEIGNNDYLEIDGTNIDVDAASAADNFGIIYTANISGEEKLIINPSTYQNIAGAGNAPGLVRSVGKCDTTTNSGQFTRVDITNVHGTPTDYNADSNLSVIGSDGVESLNVQDGAVYYDKTLNKEYVLSNNIWTEL